MKTVILAAALVLAPAACFAANANNPYGNVDHRVDAGNNTGDAQVDRLNQAQLNGARPYVPGQQPYAGAAPAAPPAYAPGYAYPPPGYPAVPYGYYAPPAYVAYPPPFFYGRRRYFYPY